MLVLVLWRPSIVLVVCTPLLPFFLLQNLVVGKSLKANSEAWSGLFPELCQDDHHQEIKVTCNFEFFVMIYSIAIPKLSSSHIFLINFTMDVNWEIIHVALIIIVTLYLATISKLIKSQYLLGKQSPWPNYKLEHIFQCFQGS